VPARPTAVREPHRVLTRRQRWFIEGSSATDDFRSTRLCVTRGGGGPPPRP
jgi:hypothetical protein